MEKGEYGGICTAQVAVRRSAPVALPARFWIKPRILNAENSPAPWRRDPCPVLPRRRLRLAEDAERGDGGADRPLRPEEEPGRHQDRPRARRLLGEQGRTALADREVAAQEAAEGLLTAGADEGAHRVSRPIARG